MRVAQDVFYRALQVRCKGIPNSTMSLTPCTQACPGAKVLYLDITKHNPRKMQEVLDILQEKELHLRTPVEEVEEVASDV